MTENYLEHKTLMQDILLDSYYNEKPSLWLSSRQSGMTSFLQSIAVSHAVNVSNGPTS